MRFFDDEERRARLGRNHLLTRKAQNVRSVADALVGVHSSDPASVYLAMWARIPGFEVEHLERALYEERSLLRILGMRRTMFVVPAELAETIHVSSTTALAEGQRRRTIRMIEDAGIANDAATWLESVSTRTVEALRSQGTATAAELKIQVPELGEKLTYHRADGSVLGSGGMSTRVLFLLAVQGRIVRARPRGTWLSSQYEWAAIDQWAGLDLGVGGDRSSAQLRLLEKWLLAYGPATEADIRWWTGWPLGDVRRALDGLDTTLVETNSGPAFLMGRELDPVPPPGPWIALLPALDSTSMGWKNRDWYLGGHGARLYDRSGNAGATVWVDGRMTGAWAQRSTGEVVFHLLEDVGREATESVEARADQLEQWLAGTVVTARFRSPLERDLATS